MKATVKKIDEVFYIISYIKYSDKKQVKRIYNLNGELVDAIPIKNNIDKG